MSELKSSLEQKAPDGYKINPEFIEKRTKRIQLIMQPSVYNAAKNKAEQNGMSFNEYVHKIIIADLDSD